MCWEWICFGFHNDVYLCHNVVTGRRTPNISSKDDIIFIESCELSIVSIYGTVITVEYVDHNNEWQLTIIGRISSCDLDLYVFVGHMKRKIHVFFHYPK